MVIASAPPASATSMAARTISSRLSVRCRAGGGGCSQIGGLGASRSLAPILSTSPEIMCML